MSARPETSELMAVRYGLHVGIDPAGVELAVLMINELERCDADGEDEPVTKADCASLEDWARRGRPFRNVVLDYLQQARAAGTDVEAAFCAVLSDFVSLGCQGFAVQASRYTAMYGLKPLGTFITMANEP